MQSARIRELEDLLQQALESVVIERGSSGSMSLDDYRGLLRRGREYYDASAQYIAGLCRIGVQRANIYDDIVEIVRSELSDHVRDGRIHSATIAVAGGMSDGSPVEDVARNVLRRACVDGPAVAAKAFSDCVANESCSVYRFFLISGIRVPAPFEIFEGIALVPLPDAIEELPPYLPFVADAASIDRHINLGDFVGRTLVRVEYAVSPIFHRPAETYSLASGPDQHFRVEVKGQEAQDVVLNAFYQSLAVAGRCRVQGIATWTSLLDYEIFDLSTFWGIGASGYEGYVWDFRGTPTVDLGQRQLETVRTLYNGLSQPSTDTWDRLRIPVDRWMKSMLESDPVDQMIDLGIALESLYLPDGGGELSFRFALNGAWHQGSSVTERRALFEEFRDIYNARSDVVHAGRFRGDRAKPTFDAEKFIERVQDLCWRGITSFLDEGEFPDWNKLVMGDSPVTAHSSNPLADAQFDSRNIRCALQYDRDRDQPKRPIE